MRLRREGESWQLGAAPGAPWSIGVLEGAGATLWWPAGAGLPGGVIWDAPLASGWIDAIWPGTTTALAAAGAFGAPRAEAAAPASDDADRPAGPLAEAARLAALAGWRAAWWPASRVAGVPPLDPRLVAAELVVALAELDGALDDDREEPDALDRALAGYASAVEAFGAVAQAPGAAGPARLIGRAEEIAADHGLALGAPAPAERAEDYALAAGGERAAAAVTSGADRVDPSVLPQGVVDPAGELTWHVAIGAAGASLSVSVPAAPQFSDAPPPDPGLRARIADAEVELGLHGQTWEGRSPVPATFLALPPERRTAVLFVPGLRQEGAHDDAGGHRHPAHEHPTDQLIRIARERLASPETDSEREAR